MKERNVVGRMLSCARSVHRVNRLIANSLVFVSEWCSLE